MTDLTLPLSSAPRRNDRATRGSRKHVLSWTDTTSFASDLKALVRPCSVEIDATRDEWMPRGYGAPAEAQLDSFGPRCLAVDDSRWNDLAKWWFVHERGANTPNWDIACTADIGGTRGLILVEAKAHDRELSTAGKRLKAGCSSNSRENHDRIGAAIREAREALLPQLSGVRISSDSHYQLANRLAFAWRLASLGVPTLLVYLGFIGDSEVGDLGQPFRSHDDWTRAFRNHAASVWPDAGLEMPIQTPASQFTVLLRSRPVVA